MIAILVCKQINSNSIKNEITYELILHILYIYLNVCKEMTSVKLSLLHRIISNHFTMWKKKTQARLKMLSTKCVYKSCI